MKSFLRSAPVQLLLAKLLSLYLWLALRTQRWSIDGQAHFVPHAAGQPAVFAFWHEFLPLMPQLPALGRRQTVYRRTGVYVLVSRHRDGRFIAAAVKRFGVDSIHGSTSKDGASKGGAASLRAMLGALARGDMIALAPDGPRGPRHQAAPGVAQLAALAEVPILPCAARTSRRIQLRTWDRMAIPLPFGRAVMVFGATIRVPRDAWKETVPQITAALQEVADRAERLCPAG
ncbi:lysophospholipid acyltransferase family protein [Rhodopila sp.]|jgi:lysophospholipid acyltransferase (LPLAT)-like uncharacterized protein|uniref:lysophospholipid acyltransferase family protein n=1 Tax=Rhodopila sp. TaxID=2480087 RepID=UPI002BDA8616|nr:lysophospholipid acyltransferase family protein [Rhodopila sp.]HVZ06968.1 lysophospholipid acyltransferase family protein [Rhodopila sp.]